MTNICEFATLFKTWPKLQYTIYDRCADTVGLNIIFEEFFFYGLIKYNDEKVASSKKHTKFKTRVEKANPVYGQIKMAKIDTRFITKTGKTIPFGSPHAYIAHITEYPTPQGEVT